MIVHKKPLGPEAHAVDMRGLAPASALLAEATRVWLTCHGDSGSIGMYQVTGFWSAVAGIEAEG